MHWLWRWFRSYLLVWESCKLLLEPLNIRSTPRYNIWIDIKINSLPYHMIFICMHIHTDECLAEPPVELGKELVVTAFRKQWNVITYLLACARCSMRDTQRSHYSCHGTKLLVLINLYLHMKKPCDGKRGPYAILRKGRVKSAVVSNSVIHYKLRLVCWINSLLTPRVDFWPFSIFTFDLQNILSPMMSNATC